MHEPKAILRSVATASPGEPVSQEALKKILCDLWIGSDRALQTMLNVFDTAGVRSRHFALPLQEYVGLENFTQRNEKFIETARVLNVQAARKALARAGLLPEDVTHVMVVTSTGIATPSLDARLINDLPLPGSVRRCPVWGLGCGAGGASLGLAADFARSSPDAVVLVVVVELCSLAFVPGTKTKLNLVASALFGDGAAAVVVTGSGSGLELTSHRTTTWPDTLDMMGWNVGDEGLGLVLSRNLPAFARERMPDVMGDLYASVGWASDELPVFAALHPGGPKVLEALAEGTGLPDHLLAPARRVLSNYGNMSAPTFLYVLEDILTETPEPSGPGIYSVMGPGFTCDCGVLTPVPVPAEA